MIYGFSIEGVTPEEYETLDEQKKGILEHIVSSLNGVYSSMQSTARVPNNIVSFKYNLMNHRIDLYLRRNHQNISFVMISDLTPVEDAVGETLILTLEHRLYQMRTHQESSSK